MITENNLKHITVAVELLLTTPAIDNAVISNSNNQQEIVEVIMKFTFSVGERCHGARVAKSSNVQNYTKCVIHFV